MHNLNVALLQVPLIWENAGANRDQFTHLLDRLNPVPDLVLLPETFASGFTMKPAGVAEKMDGFTVTWLLQQAEMRNLAIGGSLIIEEKGHYYNRFILAGPDGIIAQYDKKHLFRMAGEHEAYTEGTSQIIAEVKGWKINLQICYDLRFPVWSRNTGAERGNYDLLVYVANWPERRAPHWRTLLPARAIENQCYVAAVNRVGVDGNEISYRGDSTLIDPMGNILATAAFSETVLQASLNYSHLETWRKNFPAWMDADNFSL